MSVAKVFHSTRMSRLPPLISTSSSGGRRHPSRSGGRQKKPKTDTLPGCAHNKDATVARACIDCVRCRETKLRSAASAGSSG